MCELQKQFHDLVCQNSLSGAKTQLQWKAKALDDLVWYFRKAICNDYV